MCIRNDRRFAKNISHDQVGTFSSDTGKLEKCIEILRNLVMILLVEDTHARADVTGFTFSQAAGADNCFNILRFGSCQCGNIRIFCVEILDNNIDAGIGTLCCQTDAYQKLPGIVVIQSAVCVRIFFF